MPASSLTEVEDLNKNAKLSLDVALSKGSAQVLRIYVLLLLYAGVPSNAIVEAELLFILPSLAIVNPVYFLCMMIGAMNNIKTIIAVSSGALLGPVFYLATPEWSILIAGIVGGSIAFLIKDKKNVLIKYLFYYPPYIEPKPLDFLHNIYQFPLEQQY